MTGDDDWRLALAATERFANIQKIDAGNAGPGSGFELENRAFESAATRAAYDAAVDALCKTAEDGHDEADVGADTTENAAGDALTRTIGRYTGCRYVASGASADVYRSGAVALKVITCGRSMPPHQPEHEAKMLATLRAPVVPLLETFVDAEQQLVLVFPFLPLSLDRLLRHGAAVSRAQLLGYMADVLAALVQLHGLGIVHRDVKPSAVLLASADGPAYLSDLGTAWHPDLSVHDEPPDNKILDVGTGPYRAPETLFGDAAYGPAVDMWAVGTVLAECARPVPRTPLFASRAAHEDGNQLGLVLSIFQTLGTPTRATWPEAAAFKTPPFDMYREFPARPWEAILPDVDADIRSLVAALVRYDGTRLSSTEVSTPTGPAERANKQALEAVKTLAADPQSDKTTRGQRVLDATDMPVTW